MEGRPTIFEYLDYRLYLRDVYLYEKARRPQFSYRYFSRQAGFSSPNFLKLVIDGQRNLGGDSVERFCKALKLPAEEARFFGDLVALKQASSNDEANRAFDRVSQSRRFQKTRKIDGAMFEYLSSWYCPAIRELAGRPDFKDEPAWIARRLVPRITTAEAKSALKLLFELGLLVRGEDGRVVRGEPSLTTGHEVHSIAVVNYHRQMLERAAGAIELVRREQRDISALTVCISASTVAELKERIHRFRDELLERCDTDPKPGAVYQVNIQLFPLTQPDEEDAS
jgi:uncharacterized protein (TIGR02147 family)